MNASASRQPHAGAFSQETRLVRLHTPWGPDALVAEDVDVWECVGPRAGPSLGDTPANDWTDGSAPWALDARLGPARAGLRAVVHAVATDAALPVQDLIGRPALLELLCQDSAQNLRPWHAHVVAASRLGCDGGFTSYRLVLEPWLALLAHRSDAWAFQDVTVPQVLEAVFTRRLEGGELAPAWRWNLADPAAYPRRSLCVQHGESDLDFVLRLLREEGLFCWWEHAGDAAAPALGRHTLVIADHNGAFIQGHAHDAVLTGHRSQSLNESVTGAGGWTHFVMDDSPDAARMELSTSRAASQLQLGALLHQQGNERLAPRGQGLSLDSEAHGALRAGAGLLISAHAAPDSTNHGQQMDVRAPLDGLQRAREQLIKLAESAQAHGAKLADESPGRPLPVAKALQELTESFAATRDSGSAAWGTAKDEPPGDKFSGRMDLYEHFVRHEFKDVRYAARTENGHFVEGSLDEHGRSPQLYAEETAEMEISAGRSKSEWDLIFDHEDADALNADKNS